MALVRPTLAILQARMTSTRLPGKVMRPLLGEPMLGRQVERLRRAEGIARIVMATSDEASDDGLADYARGLGLGVHRGDLHDVLDRLHGALLAEGAPQTFLRLTADCPLADPELIDRAIAHHVATGADYTATGLGGTFPKGLDVEVCETAALIAAWTETPAPYDREHVTPFVYNHPERFRVESLSREPPERWRWTVDTPEDFAFVQAVYADLYPSNPAFTSDDILAWQAAHPGRAIPNAV